MAFRMQDTQPISFYLKTNNSINCHQNKLYALKIQKYIALNQSIACGDLFYNGLGQGYFIFRYVFFADSRPIGRTKFKVYQTVTNSWEICPTGKTSVVFFPPTRSKKPLSGSVSQRIKCECPNELTKPFNNF